MGDTLGAAMGELWERFRSRPSIEQAAELQTLAGALRTAVEQCRR